MRLSIGNDGFIQFGDGPLIPATDIRLTLKRGPVRVAADLCLHPRDREPQAPREGKVQYPVMCAREAGHAGQHHFATFPAKPTIQGELVPPAFGSEPFDTVATDAEGLRT